MRIKAAVLEEKAGPFVLHEVEQSPPRKDEVLVRIVASGICQTDLHVRDQEMPVPLPLILGHEGAGIVESVGESVNGLEPGDHVVLSYPSCLHCRFCRSGRNYYCEHSIELCFGGSRLDRSDASHWPEGHAKRPTLHSHFFAQSSFATYAIAHESNVVRVPKDIALDILAPLGCGMQTGAGAVINGLKVHPGSNIAVIGVGAVGLAAVMAAKLAGATRIIALDVEPDRLATAQRLGATDTIDASEPAFAESVAAMVRGGVNFVLECSGKPEMLSAAVNMLSATGVAALVGGAPSGAAASIDMTRLLNGRTVRGIIQGEAIPQLFIPQMIEWFRAGLFPFDQLLRHYNFEDINRAVDDVREGSAIKAVLRMDQV